MSSEIEVGDLVENILHPDLDHRTVIQVGRGWIWLDFQQGALDAGLAPQMLPIENYRVVRKA